MITLATVLALSALAAGSASPTSDERVGVWPLRPQPEIVADFDPPDSPYGAGHRGVDLAGTVGQRVHTALAGEVSYAGPLAGVGVVVVVHGHTRTTYQPLEASVSVGDALEAGDPIGTLASPGSHCPPRACLHWGWLEGDTYLDPLRLVGAGPVRLLPLWRDEPVSTLAPIVRAGPEQPYLTWRPLLQLIGLA